MISVKFTTYRCTPVTDGRTYRVQFYYISIVMTGGSTQSKGNGIKRWNPDRLCSWRSGYLRDDCERVGGTNLGLEKYPDDEIY